MLRVLPVAVPLNLKSGGRTVGIRLLTFPEQKFPIEHFRSTDITRTAPDTTSLQPPLGGISLQNNFSKIF